MSRVVVIEKNKDGKIELTKEELQKMLDDAYTLKRVIKILREFVLNWPEGTYPEQEDDEDD